jgi:septal ring-binding cell division protein DamX
MMSLSNAHYVDTAGKYNVTVTPEEGDPFEYAVAPDDDAPLAVAIREAMAVNPIPIAPYVPPAPRVPSRISSRQFFLQLDADGLLDLVEGWISGQPLDVQIAFERSSTFVRDDVMLQKGFNDLGFSPAQIDEFFASAAAR